MFLSIIFAPLLSFLFVCLFGRFFGTKGSAKFTIINMAITAFLALVSFYKVCINQTNVYVDTSIWMESSLLEIPWSFIFDPLTSVMMVVVTSVSFLVHLYASEYMSEDPHLPRFMSYLSFFTFFMLILISANNFVQLFVGWEGVGLCSYLLINFWFLRMQANKSAIKAMVMNRVGDLGLYVGLFFIFTLTGSLDFGSVFASSIYFLNTSVNILMEDYSVFTLICICLFIGSVGKSAQIGLHTWLPDAMEGPTPVSALIHAATMVTAGVFLILRCSFLFELSSTALLVLTFVGSITSFFAATVGVFQNDLKKVIAYSTCSQLGYMIFVCGISGYSVSLYHLANHAFFKALLFLSAGSIIHAIADEQDMRKMGGLVKLLPFSYTMIMIGSLSLMGFPFLTGFYSKDFILELSFASYQVSGHFAFWLGSISAFLTSFYSIRLVFLTFLAKTNSFKHTIMSAHDAPIKLGLPLAILAIPSIFLGYLWKDMFIGPASLFFNNSFFVSPTSLDLMDAEFIPFKFKIIPVVFSFLGALLSYLIYYAYNMVLDKQFYKQAFKPIYFFFNQKWYIDHVYNYFIGEPLLKFGASTTFKLIDKGFLEVFGPNGIKNFVYILSKNLFKFNSGKIYNTVTFMALNIILFIIIKNFFIFEINSELFFIYAISLIIFLI